MLKAWVIRKMTEWHESPNGGRCPRAGTPAECSQYGIASVRRHGAIIGTAMAVRHVAACRPAGMAEPPCSDNPGVNPKRWTSAMSLSLLAGLHLREALPSPQRGSSPCAGLGLFSVLALSIGNGSPWPDPPKHPGFCSGMDLSGGKLPEQPCGTMGTFGVIVMFVRLALLSDPSPSDECGGWTKRKG